MGIVSVLEKLDSEQLHETALNSLDREKAEAGEIGKGYPSSVGGYGDHLTQTRLIGRHNGK
jgi:hypothetical protein